MANEMIYEFKQILQETETNQETQQIRALKQNVKALNKNFQITSNLKQLNLLYAAAMKIIADADGNEIDFDNSKGDGGFTFLHYAVWANATGLVKTFLQHEGIDVNAQSDAGLTALQLAIIQNSPKILKILLSHSEIDLNLACLDGWTALHLAVSYGYEELIAEILKFKSKLQIDARMRHQITPLQLAALLDKGNLVKILLENGADDQLTTETGETALKVAEKFKCPSAVEILRMHAAAKILLENSAPKAATFQSALVPAQLNTLDFENRPKITETETSQNLTPNASQPPPAIYDFSADGVNDAAILQLFRVTFEGKIDEMKSLLSQGNTDLEAVHKSGKNIWDFAILNGDPSIIECLLAAKNQDADLTDLLFKAAKMGSLPIVKYLIEVKVLKPQRRNQQNQPLLIAATLSGSLELVRYLIEIQCADINEEYEKKVAFDYAAIEGNLKMMLYLVKKYDFKFIANIGGSKLSILFQFVRVGSSENVKYLIEVEKLEFKDKKGSLNGTILHEAALNKNVEVIKYFVEEHGLNVLGRDDDGNVPLFYAVECNNLDAVKYFMEDLNLSVHLKNKKNRTALHVAILNGRLEIVRYLVEEKKANIYVSDLDDVTPLMLSAQNGTEIVIFNYLWKLSKVNLDLKQLFTCFCAAIKGKNVEKINLVIEEIKVKLKTQNFNATTQEIVDFLLNWRKYNFTGNKSEFLFAAARDGSLALIKFLIEEFGLEANMSGKKNRTVLHIAAMNGHSDIVRYLVEEKKVNTHAKDNDGATPLLLSFKCLEKATANSGHVEVMKYLWQIVNGDLNLEKLVDYILDAKYGKNSAVDRKKLLFDAVWEGSLTLIKFLIEDVGLDANMKSENNRTVLHIAALNGHLEIVRYLVEEKKVNVHARDKDDATPLILSFKNPEKATANSGHVDVMKYLWKMVNGSLRQTNLDKLVDYIRVAKYGSYSAIDKRELLSNVAREGNFTLIKFLIEDVGMDANVKDNMGRTPIFDAVVGGKLEAVKYFVECAKVDIHVRNCQNQTLRAYARYYGWNAIESYLASKGAPY